MMKRIGVSTVRLGLLAGIAAALTGCLSTTRVVQKTQAPEAYKTLTVEQLEQEVSDRDAALKTLNAQVMVTASTGGSKAGKVTEYTSFKGYIFVEKPARLRVILQVPLVGSRAMDMVSDGSTFTLMRKDSHLNSIWLQGSNVVSKPSKNGLENLRPPVFFDSLLVPGVTSNEYVSMTESTRVLQPETKHTDAVEEPDYDLAVSKVKSGHVLQRERVVHVSRITGLPFQQDIYDPAGRLVTQALYSNYQSSGDPAKGQQFPMTIFIKRPLDEYSLKIDVTKLTLNEAFEPDQFELVIPPGTPVKKLE